MRCRDCPYIREEFERRINHKNIRKFYPEVSWATVKDIEEAHCYCPKTGAKLYLGRCSDAAD